MNHPPSLPPSNNDHFNLPSSTTILIIFIFVYFEAATMKFIVTTAALAHLVTAQRDYTPQTDYSKPVDYGLSKYHLSSEAEGAIHHSAWVLSGLANDDQTREYSHCIYTVEGVALYDWQCFCRGGDGEGSAIMSEALQLGQVWEDGRWNSAFGTSSVSL